MVNWPILPPFELLVRPNRATELSFHTWHIWIKKKHLVWMYFITPMCITIWSFSCFYFFSSKKGTFSFDHFTSVSKCIDWNKLFSIKCICRIVARPKDSHSDRLQVWVIAGKVEIFFSGQIGFLKGDSEELWCQKFLHFPEPFLLMGLPLKHLFLLYVFKKKERKEIQSRGNII